MSWVKYVEPRGWDWDRPVALPVKYGSRGLIGNDRTDFLKVASHVFVDLLDRIKVARDEQPLHLIGLGAWEPWGFNRNGDGFKEAECRDYHDTFVKLGHFFRNHRNKVELDHPYYGIIKASAYNNPMRRVELFVLLNAAKSAADRNGGLIADKECEKLARGEDLDVSMACHVPHDECSYCGNLARHRGEYCTSEKCAAGGCRDNLAKLVKVGNDWHHLGVFNPRPAWFDMSHVIRRADRIALGGAPDYMDKAAADEVLGDFHASNEDALPLAVRRYVGLGVPVGSESIFAQIKLAGVLPIVEAQEMTGCPSAVLLAFHSHVQPSFDVSKLGQPGSVKCAAALHALACRKIILPFRDFTKLAGQVDLTEQAARLLPGAYARWTSEVAWEQDLRQNQFSLAEKTAGDDVQRMALAGTRHWSLSMPDVHRRSQLGVLRNVSVSMPAIEKVASTTPEAWRLVRNYLAYKTAALETIAAFDTQFPLTVRLALCQNLVN